MFKVLLSAAIAATTHASHHANGVSCASPPVKILTPTASYENCSSTRLTWAAPSSCSSVTKSEIRCVTSEKHFAMTSTITGSANSWAVDSAQLMRSPFNIGIGQDIVCMVRSENQFGWGQWSEPNAPYGLPSCTSQLSDAAAACICASSCRSTGCNGCCGGSANFWSNAASRACCGMGACGGCNVRQSAPVPRTTSHGHRECHVHAEDMNRSVQKTRYINEVQKRKQVVMKPITKEGMRTEMREQVEQRAPVTTQVDQTIMEKKTIQVPKTRTVKRVVTEQRTVMTPQQGFQMQSQLASRVVMEDQIHHVTKQRMVPKIVVEQVTSLQNRSVMVPQTFMRSVTQNVQKQRFQQRTVMQPFTSYSTTNVLSQQQHMVPVQPTQQAAPPRNASPTISVPRDCAQIIADALKGRNLQAVPANCQQQLPVQQQQQFAVQNVNVVTQMQTPIFGQRAVTIQEPVNYIEQQTVQVPFQRSVSQTVQVPVTNNVHRTIHVPENYVEQQIMRVPKTVQFTQQVQVPVTTMVPVVITENKDVFETEEYTETQIIDVPKIIKVNKTTNFAPIVKQVPVQVPYTYVEQVAHETEIDVTVQVPEVYLETIPDPACHDHYVEHDHEVRPGDENHAH